MPVIADTAYPRLPADPGPVELEAFTPEPAELAFARQRARQPGPRLALLVLLKTFQHLGRITRSTDVPAGIVHHIAAIAGLQSHTDGLAGYSDTTYRVRLAALVRGYLGVAAYVRRVSLWRQAACARGVVIGPKTYRRLSDKPRGRRPDIFRDHWEEMARCLEGSRPATQA